MSILRMEPAAPLGFTRTPIAQVPEANSQTFYKGCPVVAASGKVGIAGSSSASVRKIRAAASDKVLGIAQDAGNNNTSAANMPVALAMNGMGFYASVQSSSASKKKVQSTDLYNTYGLQYSASTKHFYVNKDESSASFKCVQVTRLVDAVGTSNGRVIVEFRDAWLQHGK